MSNLFPLFPYFWLAMIASAIFAVIVAALRGRPKKAKKSKNTPAAVAEGGAEGFGESEPVLDFGDEISQMESK